MAGSLTGEYLPGQRVLLQVPEVTLQHLALLQQTGRLLHLGTRFRATAVRRLVPVHTHTGPGLLTGMATHTTPTYTNIV